MKRINSLGEIQDFLNSFIPKNDLQKYKGEWGLGELVFFLQKINCLKVGFPVIHISGTSGKGSTAVVSSCILQSVGLKTGLCVSPFFQDFREYFQINNTLLAENLVVRYFQDFLNSFFIYKPKLSYFEILAAFMYFVFTKEKVEVAVVEVGMGGRFDCTNAIDPDRKICLINQIGFDHTEILGKTVEKIAWQKAGIIKPKSLVYFIEQEYTQAAEVIKKEAKKSSIKAVCVKKNVDFKVVSSNISGSSFWFKDYKTNQVFKLSTSLLGNFQAQNCALALTGVLAVLKLLKKPVDWQRISSTLKKITIPNRLEILRLKDKIVVFDGAHNPQKMQSLLSALQSIFGENIKYNFLVSFVDTKDALSMLKILKISTKNLIYSEFCLLAGNQVVKRSKPFNLLLSEIKPIDLLPSIYHITNPQQAYNFALKKTKPRDILVVTGSLYFLSVLRNN